MLSQGEELANAITHGIGLVLSVAGGVVLWTAVAAQGDIWRWVGCSLYAASLIGVYLASTLSHCVSHPGWRNWCRMLDQALIYLLIAGTYTPFALVYLRSSWWSLLLALMWTMALAGFCSKMWFAHRVDRVAVWLYLGLGWIPIVTGFPLVHLVPSTGLWWMLIGGLCYSVGTIFLCLDRMVRHFHAVWHVCVIAGSTWHFLAIWMFVARPGAAAL